ncbi:hemerythrin domain-containing protein [Streptomyces sp. NA02950]|uniref:hemerythrin domain-containing protein n=1 Tax=Streptomyces sp. NA02950 TaxID=2742137 RepID=UPI001590B104|nr:hemerythrin domain-containing protein [Streptomyces sp. NA02950]QKV90665.1 hemerythrin domain-containing protein [Streptomyces sp. NA02950]
MGHGGNVIEELTTDHREVEELFHQIRQAPSADERKGLADQLTIELVRHSVAEEMHLYPAVREHLPGGDALADKEIADHTEVEKLLKALEDQTADNQEFDRLIARLETEVTSHVRDEETNLFAQLRGACSPGTLEELGEKVRTAKKVAPTRPHPSAPSTPPGNKLLAPGAGLVDRARDFVSGRGK